MIVREFGLVEAAAEIRVPTPDDDKYSRGVIGFATGSLQFPGAAMLGIDGALATGVGMVRYEGPDKVGSMIVSRRPEVVISPGRASVWVVGSGMDPRDTEAMGRVRIALADGSPVIVDAGALGNLPVSAPSVATPHAGELAQSLGIDRAEVEADRAGHALLAAQRWHSTVVLKGSVTHIADARGQQFAVDLATPWLAIAGAGDVLAGVIGAIAATNVDRVSADPDAFARIAAAGVVVHSVAATRASAGGPFRLGQLVDAIPDVVSELVSQ